MLFTADLACVWWFWLRVFSGQPQLSVEGRTLSAAAFRAVAAIVKLTAKPCAAVSLAALWLFAWPEQYPPKDRLTLWTDPLGFNVFDDLLCREWLWRGFCRRLEVRGATLLRSGTDWEAEVLFDESDEKRIEFYHRLYGLDLTNRSLRNANLTGAYLLAAKLSDADLRGANLAVAELRGADLTRAKLHGADLRGAKLHGVQLHGAVLHDAYLNQAELHSADLTWAKLHGADLSRAELRGADLSHAELVGARLSGTALCGATLTDTIAAGTAGRPETDVDADFGSIAWKPDELPRLDTVSCSEAGPVRCHMRSRQIPFDFPLLWNPELNLLDHLLTYAEGKKIRPVWLTASNAAGELSNECR